MKKKTHEQFVQEVYNQVGNEYTIIGNYISSAIPIKTKHNKCDTVWEIRPNNFIVHKQRCPNCMKEVLIKKRTKSHEQFVEEVYQIFGDEITVIGKYSHNKKKVKVIHNKCNNIYDAQPNCLLRGNGCKKCADKQNGFNQRKTQKQFEIEVLLKGKGEYQVTGEYTLDYKHVKLKHLICNQEYLVTPTNFLQGYRCPVCNESKGERKIREFLQINKIIFTTQYKFKNLLGRNGQPLRFDFGILNNEDELLFLIEYDGEYHYLPIVDDWHLEYQQEHDNLKNRYCKENNIELFRISYLDFDKIDEILIKKFNT